MNETFPYKSLAFRGSRGPLDGKITRQNYCLYNTLDGTVLTTREYTRGCGTRHSASTEISHPVLGCNQPQPFLPTIHIPCTRKKSRMPNPPLHTHTHSLRKTENLVCHAILNCISSTATLKMLRMGDFSLAPPCKSDVRSPRTLGSVDWLVANVSGQPYRIHVEGSSNPSITHS